jgi:hypothetical protein
VMGYARLYLYVKRRIIEALRSHDQGKQLP